MHRRDLLLAVLPLALARRAMAQPALAPLSPPAPPPGLDPAPAPSYRVIDLMPDWWAFAGRAQGLAPERQARLFLDTVVHDHPGPYASDVIGLDPAQPYEAQLLRRFVRVQALLAGREPLMRRLAASISTDLPRYEATFRRSFPDLRYAGDIYFMHSLGGFDGATRRVDGRTALLFGIDMIAYVYGTDADPQPFFHHELFHLYHAQFTGEEPDPPPVAAALWREGLATFVAQALNPAAGGVAIFGLPRDMPAQAQARLPELARWLLKDLDTRSPEAYARWFLGGSRAGSEVPARSGYYIGFLVARQLAARRSLAQLARAPIPSLHTEIEAALQALSR